MWWPPTPSQSHTRATPPSILRAALTFTLSSRRVCWSFFYPFFPFFLGHYFTPKGANLFVNSSTRVIFPLYTVARLSFFHRLIFLKWSGLREGISESAKIYIIKSSFYNSENNNFFNLKSTITCFRMHQQSPTQQIQLKRREQEIKHFAAKIVSTRSFRDRTLTSFYHNFNFLFD